MKYSGFNKKSRTENTIKSSVVSSSCEVVSLVSRFAFRTAFIYLLSSEYLGIEGLFTNILNVLSLSELGIGTAITFKLYQPIKDDDVVQVGRLIGFYRRVYQIIALIIITLGMLCVPFLSFFINDTSSVPSEINLRLVFVLYLFQTASTYLYSYKQALLAADQKQYVVALIQCLIKVLLYVVQIGVLVFRKDYTLTLILGIFVTLICNMGVSVWITYKYKSVFQIKEKISDRDKKEILKGMGAVLCHKIGGTIFTSTDSIVLSKFAGLAVTGVYSNYSMLISGATALLNKAFGSFTASFGNAHISLSRKENYAAFMKVFLLNLLFSGGSAVCIWILIDDFIILWAGTTYLLNSMTVMIIVMQYYLEAVRIVMTSYTFGSGLFHKDRLRPFIEAGLNLTISIVLVIRVGIVGVFLGTIISYMITVFWREPYLLFKYEFCTSSKKFWLRYLCATMFTFIVAIGSKYLLNQVLFYGMITWPIFLIKAVLCISIYSVCVVIVYGKNEDFVYCIHKLLKTRKKQ